MKRLNDGKQMTDVWRMPAIGRWEKTCGKHPTQKPLRLLVRMMAKTEHSHPLGMVVSTHFRCGKGVKRGLKNGALPFNID